MPLSEAAPEPQSRAVRFSLLGPLSVTSGGRPLPLGPLKQRLVLAMLLCRANTPVSLDVLADTVWTGLPPRTARKNLQQYVWALRRLLCEAGGHDRLTHVTGGYLLRVAEPELDTLRFQAYARAGREAARSGAPGPAARELRRALDLWRGSPFPELCDSEPLRAEADRLTDRYLCAQEDWAESELELGHASETVEALGELVERHPLRERLRMARMTALHRLGRQTEALAAYEELRQLLARELGLAPSPAIEALYRSILTGAEPAPGRPRPAAAVREPAPVLLPPDTADFTGRQELLAELRAAVRSGGRAAALVGPVGSGKTTLAAHLAHRMREEFPDGRLLVTLRAEDGSPRSTASVLAELAELTGLAGRLPAEPARAAALWRAWLADRRILLLLDDVPDGAAVRPLLPGAGAAGAVVISRTSLPGLACAHRVPVPPLTAMEALELLGRIIGFDRVGSDPAAAGRIVSAGGCSPLAVRVSGLRLAVLRHLPLAEYAARLAEPDAVLDELAVGDLTVRSPLADGWCELPEPGRSAMLRLGRLPFSEPFTLREAAAVLGCDEGSALRDLESLIDAGALISPLDEVTAHAARYELPRLAHLYAREVAARCDGVPSGGVPSDRVPSGRVAPGRVPVGPVPSEQRPYRS